MCAREKRGISVLCIVTSNRTAGGVFSSVRECISGGGAMGEEAATPRWVNNLSNMLTNSVRAGQGLEMKVDGLVAEVGQLTAKVLEMRDDWTKQATVQSPRSVHICSKCKMMEENGKTRKDIQVRVCGAAGHMHFMKSIFAATLVSFEARDANGKTLVNESVAKYMSTLRTSLKETSGLAVLLTAPLHSARAKRTANAKASMGVHGIALACSMTDAVKRRPGVHGKDPDGQDSTWCRLFGEGRVVDTCVADDIAYMMASKTAGGKGNRATELAKELKNGDTNVVEHDVERAAVCAEARPIWLTDARLGRERAKKVKHRFHGGAFEWMRELGGPASAAKLGLSLVLSEPVSAHELNVPPANTPDSPWDIPDMKEYPQEEMKSGQYCGKDTTIDSDNYDAFGEVRAKFPSFVVTIYSPRTVQTHGKVEPLATTTRSSNGETGGTERDVDDVGTPPAKKGGWISALDRMRWLAQRLWKVPRVRRLFVLPTN